jgi:hypothetical protein
MTPSSGRRCRSSRFGTLAPISMMHSGRAAGLSLETFELDIDGSAERDFRAERTSGSARAARTVARATEAESE